MKRITNKHGNGFTLIELMTVIAIMIIMAGIGMVYSKGILLGTGLNASTTQLTQTLQLARQNAIMLGRNIHVVFPPTTNEYWYVMCTEEGTATIINGLQFADEFNPSFMTEYAIDKTIIYNLTQQHGATGIVRSVTNIAGINYISHTPNVITAIGQKYGVESRPKGRLAKNCVFREPYFIIMFRADGSIKFGDGSQEYVIEIYDRTRPKYKAQIHLFYSGKITVTHSST